MRRKGDRKKGNRNEPSKRKWARPGRQQAAGQRRTAKSSDAKAKPSRYQDTHRKENPQTFETHLHRSRITAKSRSPGKHQGSFGSYPGSVKFSLARSAYFAASADVKVSLRRRTLQSTQTSQGKSCGLPPCFRSTSTSHLSSTIFASD